MWQYLGLTALDLANERAREARTQAEGWRLLEPDVHVRETPARPGLRPARGRRRPAPASASASLSVGEAACEAATRLEHRTA